MAFLPVKTFTWCISYYTSKTIAYDLWSYVSRLWGHIKHKGAKICWFLKSIPLKTYSFIYMMIHFPHYSKWPLRLCQHSLTASRRSNGYLAFFLKSSTLKTYSLIYIMMHFSRYFVGPLRLGQQPPRPYIWPLTVYYVI